MAAEHYCKSSFWGTEKLRKPKLEGNFIFFKLASKDSKQLVIISLNRIHCVVFLHIFNAIIQWNALP